MKYRLLLAAFVLSMAIVSGMLLLPRQAAAAVPYATTITVNSGQDFNTSMSETCTAHPSECSLRRAIVEARGLPAEDRPVLIQFNIPAEADEGYDAALQVWKLNILTTADLSVFRDIVGGQVTIDATTQPGGRPTGPKIILIGPTTNKNCLNFSSGEGYVVRGLAFQQFRVAILMSGTNSIIEDNWVGLDDEGTLPAWRDEDDHSQGSGYGGIETTATAISVTIQNNVILGMVGNAAVVRGEGNFFTNNYVGTDANGMTPGKQTDPSLVCTVVDWYGGSGLLVDGPEHEISDNLITGIRLDIFGISSQPDAIWLESTCDRCLVRANRIGLDAEGGAMGVCGQGIDITNGEQMDIVNNIFADTYHSAIFLNGALYKDNTLTGNTVRKSTPWPEPEENPKPDDAILRYTGLPDEFEFFNPAKVTLIDGTTVYGTAGDGSPCPNCIIELYLEDDDGINEALQMIGYTTADADGNWTATILFELAPNQGIRTTSTTAQYNTIPGMNAGTTAGLSVMYKAASMVYLPLISR